MPARSSGFVMPLSLNEICVVPERSKICAMSVTFVPCSIEPRTFGTHEIAKSALPEASTSIGTVSVPASLIVTSRPSSL